MKPLSSLCFLLFLGCTGCIPWVISASMEAKAQDQAAYSTYVTTMERLNTEREIAKLPPRPILTFPQWKQGGVTNTPAAAPVRVPKGQ
jgi:hypothetical protein